MTDREQTDLEPAIPQLPASYEPAASECESCGHCQAPVDSVQRYCVVCGTHRKHVHDPAARFLAEATSRSRSVRTARAPRRPPPRSSGLGLALALAAIPLAVAAGVLIGRPSNGDDSKLLAALRNQKPTVVNVASDGPTSAGTSSAGGASAAAATPVARLTSSFGLGQGYSVELETLPAAGTTQAKVATAERRARARGAAGVGLITQTDFRVTPSPPAGAYVVYSGQYHSSADAKAALARLKHAFPSAKVIAVRSVRSASSGQVLAKSAYGSAHAVSGFKASSTQLASGAKVVKQVSKELGGGYVKSQQGLPDSVSVP